MMIVVFVAFLSSVFAQFDTTQYTHTFTQDIGGFAFVVAYRKSGDSLDVLLELSLSGGNTDGWAGIGFCDNDIDGTSALEFARECAYWIVSHVGCA